MKRILLLSMTSLAVLMADITLTGTTLMADIIGETTPPPATTAPGNTLGIIPNSVDLIWEDTFGENIGWTSATGDMVQFRGSDIRANYKIGDSSKRFRIPTANIWNEIEEEGDGSVCSHSINKAVNTRVELGAYRGWWLDDSGNWHAMTASPSQGGTLHPPIVGLVAGLRGCEQQYFKDEREKFDKTKLIRPYGEYSQTRKWNNPSDINIFVKPQHYYRFHGWSSAKTIFPNDYAAKAIFIQQYARLVVDDPNSQVGDDRHLARYLVHLGSDRKEVDGKQLWQIGISRFKRVNNDWQPFNLFLGPQTKEQLEANPPPFMSVP